MLMAVALYLSYPERTGTPPLHWDAATARAALGSVAKTNQGLELTLDDAGRAVLVLPVPSVDASQYPFLRLQFVTPPAPNSLGIFWKTTDSGEQMVQYWVKGEVAESFYLGLGGISLWAGTVVELAVLIQGAPAQRFVLEAIELRPFSPVDDVLATLADWFAFVAWSPSSINTYSATSTGGATHYPVTVIGSLLAATLLAYGLLLLVLRSRIRPNWRVIPWLFLICWLCLDLVWQGKLLQQLAVTHAKFAGKDDDAKLAAGPDGALVQFMSDVKNLVAPEARIFVASGDDYRGMRGSYYLYPRNVFWARGDTELPSREYIQEGDFIVLIYPSTLNFDPEKSVIRSGVGEPLPVELLASGGLGGLFRVL
jgi:hypothetical protein